MGKYHWYSLNESKTVVSVNRPLSEKGVEVKDSAPGVM